jgi:hypothetical protein
VSEVLRSPSRRLVKIFNKHDVAVFLLDLCIKQPAAVWRDRQAIAKEFLGFQDSPDVFGGKVEVLDRLRCFYGRVPSGTTVQRLWSDTAGIAVTAVTAPLDLSGTALIVDAGPFFTK